jgi:CRISPR/Cas system CSM-associated protein Csm2 small subunit
MEPFRHHANRKEDEEKAMPKRTKYSDHLSDWASLLAALTENEGNLPHLAIPRDQLRAFLDEARGLTLSQAAQAAAKQQSSRRLEEVINVGRKLATSLRVSVKVVYGNRSEKLTEFHIQPFRGRTRKAATPPVGPEAPAPETPAL